MSAGKLAGLEGVDYDAPDVFETRSPSPSRRNKSLRGGARGAYGSSEDDTEDDDASSGSDVGGEDGRARRSNKKISGHGGRSGLSERAGKSGQAATSAANPDIENTHLDAEEAAKRFRTANGVDSAGVDFTSSIHRRRKKVQYYPRHDATYETASYSLGSGNGYHTVYTAEEDGTSGPRERAREQESPLDRFRRLRFELQELEKDLQLGQAGAAADGNDLPQELAADKIDDARPANLLSQLHALRDRAEQMQISDQSKAGEAADDRRNVRVNARKLLRNLASSDAATSTPAIGGETPYDHQEVQPLGLDAETGRLADVDERLAGLEELVGVRAAMQDGAKSIPRPLLASLARIEHLLTLLTQPRHLDGISRRIKVLVSELERAHDARRKLISAAGDSASGDNVVMSSDTLKRLDGALPLLGKIEPLLPVVPTLLARLQTLSALHASSATFAHDVDTLTALAKTSCEQSDELTTMLSNVEQSMAANKSLIEGNFAVVQDRIDALMKRIDALE